MIEDKGNELRRLAVVELNVSRCTKTGDRLEAEMQALRLGSATNQLTESVPSFSANPDQLPTVFEAGIAAASEKLRTEIAMLKEWTRSYMHCCDSLVFDDFPRIFEDFKGQKFTLLWRGSRDGFKANEFHGRCDGHPNTLTVILDMGGNIFGGFTPVKWESPRNGKKKADPSLKSFLFTLKNPHNVSAQRFALKVEKKDQAIWCDSNDGPRFSDIDVSDNCNSNTDSSDFLFGHIYKNDTGLDDQTFFTGSPHFQVKEIEVFEITD
jgi:hypothetical protein